MRIFRSTSEGQARAWAARIVPEPEVVTPGRLVAAPMATGIAHIPFSISYLVVGAGDDLHLIDPGMELADNDAHLAHAAALVGRTADDIASITISHLHTDHMGMSNALRRRTGATVRIHARDYAGLMTPNPVARGSHDEWGVPEDVRPRLRAGIVARSPIIADERIEDGAGIDLGGTTAVGVLTPGHTSGHMCVDIPELGVFLTGDHVLPTMNPGLGLGHDSASNPVSDYLASLDRMHDFDDREALPGHGHRFMGLAARSAQIASHVRRRLDEIEGVLRVTPAASVWDVASRVRWGAGWDKLNGFYMQSALHQTALYRDLALHRREAAK